MAHVMVPWFFTQARMFLWNSGWRVVPPEWTEASRGPFERRWSRRYALRHSSSAIRWSIQCGGRERVAFDDGNWTVGLGFRAKISSAAVLCGPWLSVPR